MTTHTNTPSPVHLPDLSDRPGRGRRSLLVVAGVLACGVPVVFTLNITRMLVMGIDTDHRFHQLTGQGEILFALWLLPLLALLRAGWQGRRPGTAAGWAHLVLVAAGAGCAVAAPGGGAPALVGLIGITGSFVWVALPLRPQLRVGVQVDPLLMPVALAASAVLLPYAVDQIGLQNAATTGFHSENPHYFDMAWIAVVLAAYALLAGLLPAARVLATGFVVAMVWLGSAGLALGESTAWSLSFLVVGVLTAAASVVVRRQTPRN
ncbi:hypothetical protein L2K70_17275 [Nocardioides KLBMP 9356]|uniref:Uncharacterized protein n=1 Tax=Nocardioides potassii TaxID=2911371 RepID=A0ABS9HDU2_9ACTN|nr:hypothetical protein [Nocardioides potassii]MCF6379365.1 hypothetical protein [Nocardioides potassii]